MSRLDASLLSGARYATVPGEALVRAFDERLGFLTTNRPAPVRDGFAAAFWSDGLLRHFGFYAGGKCVASLDLHPASELGVFTQASTGEVFHRGKIETLSPWSDNEAARPSDETYQRWVLEHVKAVKTAMQA